VSIFKKLIVVLMSLILIACKQDNKPPRLVVLIAVDHLAHFTYNHYLPVFTGGFKWLDEHGVTFDNAHHEHGYSATGPGHFVLGSGQYPGPAGMLGNNWYERELEKNVYCVEDPDAQALDIPVYSVSYDKVNATSFGDWLKANSPESKVYSVSCKDRASVLMGGKNPDLAIWYNWRGAFTTTDYYTDEIPLWLKDFNREANIYAYKDSLWTRSLPESVYAEYAHADSFYGETDRYLKENYSPIFPIGYEAGWDEKKVYSEIASRPWMDRITLDLASRVIKENSLGKDDTPDVLTIGLSVLDWINHYYGPYSHEAMDHLVKIDQYIEAFLKDLDQQVGLENVVFAMTTDHGGMPLPEHWTKVMGKPGGRVDEELYIATRAAAYAKIDSLYGHHDYIIRHGSSYYYNLEMMDSMGVDQNLVSSIIQSHMESVEGIYRVYTKTELLAAKPSDRNAYRLSHFMHPVKSPDLYTLIEEGWLFRHPYGTSHSTPYDYDSHAPLVFSHSSFTKTILADSVATVDIAVTLGDILGVKPTNKVDGKSLLVSLPRAAD